MKKKDRVTVWAGLLLLGLSGTAQATLYDRGGGMIYDSDQNLTWLQDANYAQTSGYDTDADGRMNWANAMSWAAGLNHGGFGDWRLPTVTDNGNNGCDYGFSGTDCGYNVDTSGSEMAYMWYDILGNTPYCDTSGDCDQAGWGLTSTGADGVTFQNLQSNRYWSGTEFAPDPDTRYAWNFNTRYGQQSFSDKGVGLYAWAVRSGDVAPVPLPAAIWLFGAGLAGLGVFGRTKGRRCLQGGRYAA